MSITAKRKITITYQGDLKGQQVYDAEDNDESVGAVQIFKFLSGAATGTTCTVPSYGIDDVSARCLTIIKPSDSTATITFKANTNVANADGHKLHPTDPDCITFDSSVTSFAIHVTADTELRFVWT